MMHSRTGKEPRRYFSPAALLRPGWLAAASLGLLILLSSCSAQHSSPARGKQLETAQLAQQAGSPFAIATPAQLSGLLPPKSRQSSYVPSDLVQQGEAFNSTLPHNRVTAGSAGAQFSPDWDGGGDGVTGLSYAVYDFRIPGFDLNPSLQYAWITEPPDYDDAYFGLANWKKDRWDWYRAVPGGRLDFASLGDYFDFGGDLLVCVLLTGTAASELDWLRVASIPPAAALTASAAYGFVPLTVEFSAAGSTDPDGTIAEYRWDPEGDGSFDQTTGTDPLLQHTYQAPGDFQAAVRVIDNDGVSTDSTLPLSAFDTTYLTLGAAMIEDVANAVVVRPDGKLLIFGRRGNQSADKHQITVALLNPNGALEFVRVWSGGTDNDNVQDAILSGDGFVYTSGWSYPEGLVQKWTLDGELVWSKTLAGMTSNTFSQIGLSNGKLYCAGFGVPGGGNISAPVVCLNTDGVVNWTRIITSPQTCQFSGLATFSSIAIGNSSVMLCGYYVPGAGQPACGMYAAFGEDGALSASQLIGGDTATYAKGIAVRGFNFATTYVSGQHYDGVSSYEAFVSKIGGSTTVFNDPGFRLNAAGMQFMGTGELALALQCTQQPADQLGALALLRVDSSFSLQSGVLLSAAPGGGCRPYNISSYSGQGLIITGDQYGGLPTASSYAPASAASSLSWSDFTPSVLSPSLTTIDRPVELTELTDYEINRGSEFESFIFVQKN